MGEVKERIRISGKTRSRSRSRQPQPPASPLGLFARTHVLPAALPAASNGNRDRDDPDAGTVQQTYSQPFMMVPWGYCGISQRLNQGGAMVRSRSRRLIRKRRCYGCDVQSSHGWLVGAEQAASGITVTATSLIQ